MTEEIQYEIEDSKGSGFREFIAKRWVRITAISVAAAIALVGAFGVGVAAGQRMASNGGGAFNSQGGFGDRGGFGGHDDFGGKFPGGVSGDARFGGPQGGFPACPPNDPDHCAGTDR